VNISARIDTPTLAGLVDLSAPAPASITPSAIAHGLGQIARWVGATEIPFSVAQHSLLVHDLLRELFPGLRRQAIHALLHDAHEYLIGDISQPAERALTAAVPEFGPALAALKGRLDNAIRGALRVSAPAPEIVAAVKTAEEVAAHIEWLRRLPAINGASPFGAEPATRRAKSRLLKPMTWAAAADAYRDALERELAERAWEKP